MTRVLVTNDDGIDATGLRVLTATLVDHGYEPLVVAPNRDYSGAAGSLLSLSADEPSFDQSELRYETRQLAEAPGVEAYAIEGPPAMCALIAMREAFGPAPGLVVSGINYGLNVGPAVMHSGTVNAALTAGRGGVPALAVSAAFTPDDPENLRYDTAAHVAMRVLGVLAAAGSGVLSLNVPARDVADLQGIRSAELATGYRYRSFIDSVADGVITRSYREAPDVEVAPDSDSALVEAGYATLSALVPIAAVPCPDIVDAVVEASA